MLRIVSVFAIAVLISATLAGSGLVMAEETKETSPQSQDNTAPQNTSEEEISSEETTSEDTSEQDSELASDSEAAEEVEAEFEIPEVSYDLDALPFPTRRMRELILEATKAGDIEKLRAYIGTGENMTLLSLGGTEENPIEFLKQQSGDAEGHELLAILEEILEAGYVHLDAGTDREIFVWPYFFAMPIDRLTDRQMVELFRIVTFGDFQDMQDFGGYIFYRVGITPTGRWQFFVAGD